MSELPAGRCARRASNAVPRWGGPPGLLFLLALLVALPAIPLASGGPIPAIAPPVAAPTSLGAAPAQEMGPPSPLPSTPAVGGTVVLADGAVLPGNVAAWNLAGPLGIAMDPAGLGVWLTGAYSGTLGLYNPANGTLLTGSTLDVQATYPNGYGGAATAMVAVPTQHELYIASPGTGQALIASSSSGAQLATVAFGNGSGPVALAYDAASSLVFVAEEGRNQVAFVSTSNRTIVANVSTGTEPIALWYDAATNELFVAYRDSSTVSVLDVSAERLLYSVQVGSDPVAFTQVGSHIWILDQGSGNISLLNDQGGSSAGSISLVSGSAGVANALVYDPAGPTVYVLNAPGGSLELLNATDGSERSTVAVGGTPFVGVYDAARGEIDFTNTARNTFGILNDTTNALVRSPVLGAAPMASFFDSSTDVVYVADASVAGLVELDARTDGIVGQLPLPAPGIDLAWSSQLGVLAIVLSNGGTEFFDPSSNSLLGSWQLTNGTLLLHATYGNGEFFFTGGQPFGPSPYHDIFVIAGTGFGEVNCIGAGFYDSGLVYDPVNHYVYVATNASVVVVSSYSNDRVTTIPLPPGGASFGIALSQKSSALMLSDWASGDIFVYNISLSGFDPSPTTLVHPGVVSYISAVNTFYVAESSGAAIESIIDLGGGSYTLGQIAVGPGPNGVNYSSLSGLLYVANAVAGTVSLVPVVTTTAVPMAVVFSITPATLAIGGSLTVRASATYPMWNDSFTYAGLPRGCPSRNASYFVCVPNQTGSFVVTVTATNTYHVSASTIARVAVFSPLTVISFVASPTEFTLGLSTRVTLSYSGGVAPVSVSYPVRPPGCSATNLTDWSCTPNAAGTFTLKVTIADSAGHNVSANRTLTVNPHLTITSFTPSVTSVKTDVPVVFTVLFSGGTAPFTFTYTGLPSGCVSTNSSTITCTPTAAGTYSPLVVITDASGATAQLTTTIDVVAPSGGGTTSVGGLSSTIVLLLVVIVLVVVVVAFALLRRSRRAGPAGPASAGSAPPPASGPAPAAPPEVTVVQPLPREPLMPPVPPVGVRTPPPPPPRYHVDETAPPPPRAQPVVAGRARPPLVCTYCGTSNEPWLTVCRKCKRSLHSTGSV